MKATVRALFVKSEKGGGATPLKFVEAIDGGFAGDHHTGSSKRRQILLVSGTVLDQLGVGPGSISENVVVDGIDVMSLEEGRQLRLGASVVTVTVPCEPCVQMERVRRGLRDALENRRGMFVKVVVPGTVRVGDPIEFL